jgi:hypothetical protein
MTLAITHSRVIRDERRFKVAYLILVSSLIIGIPACSSIEIRPLTAQESDRQVTGLRFYRPQAYIAISEDDKGNCTTKIQYLPDYRQEYVMIPHYRLGTVSFKPTLSDGWNLTAIDAAVDTKIPDTITAMTGVMQKAAAIAQAYIPTGQVYGIHIGERLYGPGLYRIDLRSMPATIEPVYYMSDRFGQPQLCNQTKVAPLDTRQQGSNGSVQ